MLVYGTYPSMLFGFPSEIQVADDVCWCDDWYEGGEQPMGTKRSGEVD